MPPKVTRKQAKILGNLYRGYIPPGLPQNKPPNRIKYWWKVLGKPRLTVYPQPEVEEWSKEPEYPPLNDASKSGLRRQVRLDWYESLKSKPTVEDKLHDITSRSAHRMALINNWLPCAKSLSFVKYLTQTHTINSLPIGYDVASKRTDDNTNPEPHNPEPDYIDQIQTLVLDQIALEKYESETKKGYYYVSKQIRDGNRSSFVSNRFIEHVVNQARKSLVYETNPQLLDYQIDLSPGIRSWFYHSGFESPNKSIFYKSRRDENGNINTIFQIDGSSALNMRYEHMIEPIVDMGDPMVTDTNLVAISSYHPKYYGAIYKFKRPVALPGFWFEEVPKYDCPHTCFLSTDCLSLRKSIPKNFASTFDDEEDCLTAQAILTGFSWLNSLSMYHGYTPFQEMDYPFTCQVITTNGQDWMFNVYQLNGHTFHRDLGGAKRNNLCWSSGLMRLYEDYQGGNFVNLNKDVIKLLVKFMSKQANPEYTSQLNMRPYLHEDTRTVEEKEKIRARLIRNIEGRYNKRMAANWLVPEWEKIFFRNKVTRHQITNMKPEWHPPKPRYPKVFE